MDHNTNGDEPQGSASDGRNSAPEDEAARHKRVGEQFVSMTSDIGEILAMNVSLDGSNSGNLATLRDFPWGNHFNEGWSSPFGSGVVDLSVELLMRSMRHMYVVSDGINDSVAFRGRDKPKLISGLVDEAGTLFMTRKMLTSSLEAVSDGLFVLRHFDAHGHSDLMRQPVKNNDDSVDLSLRIAGAYGSDPFSIGNVEGERRYLLFRCTMGDEFGLHRHDKTGTRKRIWISQVFLGVLGPSDFDHCGEEERSILKSEAISKLDTLYEATDLLDD